MPQKVHNFLECLNLCGGKKPHLLLGNGFSIDWRADVFRYDSLYAQADFSKLNPKIQKLFKHHRTQNFEFIMQQLISTAQTLKVYDPSQKKLIAELIHDAEALKAVLVRSIADNHPNNPSVVTESEYRNCKGFLLNFDKIYTLNYDLLLYWTGMHFQDEEVKPEKKLKFDDGFRKPESGEAEYVSWEVENTDRQNIFYLHGALHIFDARSEIQKFTWINTGVSLMEQIRSALAEDKFPLFVSEGASREKKERIIHSNYLSRGYRSIAKVGGNLFIHGHSLAENDQHILKLISKSKIKQLFISLHGEPGSDNNKNIIKKAAKKK